MKRKNIKYKIDINSIRNESEQNLEAKINGIKDSNLSYLEKMCKVLAEEKTKINKIQREICNIDIKKINEEWENQIRQKIEEIKDINLSYFQKRLLILSQLKTTSYSKEENDENQKSLLKKSINSSSSGSSTEQGEERKIKFFDDGIEVSKISKRKKNYPNFYIDIEYFRDQNERFIWKKMKNFEKLGLNDFEKRIKVLKDEKASTVDLQKYIKSEKIDIFKIMAKKEEEIKAKMEKKTEKNLNEYEKREKVLQEEKTTTEFVNNDNQIDHSEINYSFGGNSMEKTADITDNKINDNDLEESFLNKSISFYHEFLISSEKEKKEFNSIRAKFYIKHKLYDIPLGIENHDAITPQKYKISDKFFGFLYPNDLQTYYITVCGFLLSPTKDGIEINKNDEKYDSYLGLYFCGETVEIFTKNGKEKKKCSKNEFICKDCMKINKSNYHLKNNQLININGRVSKINKGKYHCFGHFLVGNIIEDCITKFSCKACQNLDLISDIYK